MTLANWHERLKALPISQAQIARMVGVSNPTLTNHLTEKKRMGIYYHYRLISIIEQLEQLYEYWTVTRPPLSK